MKIERFAFTGIPVTDMPRAREFYEGVLGLNAEETMAGEHWVEYDVAGQTLALACIGEVWRPSEQGTSAAFEMEDLESALRELDERGIKYERYESPCCWMANVRDPDGNGIVLHKLKPE